MSSGGRGTYSIRVNLDSSQAISALGQLKTQLGGLGVSFQTSSGQVNQAAMSFERYNTAAQRTVGTSSALSGSLGRVNNPLRQFNIESQVTNRTLPKMANAQNQAAMASQKSAQAMQAQIQRATALGSRIGGMAFMFTGLTAAMGEAQGMQSLLEEQQKKLTEAQIKAEDAVKKYGEGSFQATRALEAMKKEEKAVAFQSRITTLSIQDQFFFIGGLASIALPSVITAFGKLRTAMKAAETSGKSFGAVMTASLAGASGRFTSVINAMTLGLNRLTPSLLQVNTAMGASAVNTVRNTTALSTYTVATGAAAAGTRSLSVALTGLLRHPVVLTIAALATAFLALQQNVFGVTDRFREFGIALGQALPILQPFLNLLDGIAATLGITGDAAVDASERFRTAFEGFGNLSTLWHDTLAGMQRSESEIVQFFGNVGVVISDFVVNAGDQFRQFAESMIVDWNEVIPQIQDTLQGLGDWFADFFTSLPGTLGSIAMEMLDALGILKLADMIASNPVLRQMGEAVMSFVDFIQDVSQDIIKRLGLDKVAAEIVKVLQGAALVASGTAPSKNIPETGPGIFGLPEIQQQPFMGQQEEVARQEALKRALVPEGGGLFRAPQDATQQGFGVRGKPQTIEDLQALGVGQDQFTSRFGGGIRQLTPSTAGGGLGLTPRLQGIALPPDAMSKAIEEARKQQQGMADEGIGIWNNLLKRGVQPATKGVDDFTAIIKEYQKTEDTSDAVVNRVIEAHKVAKQVYDDTGNAIEANNAAQQVMNGTWEESVDNTEDAKTVLGELKDTNQGLQTTYDQTAQAIQNQSFMQEKSREGTLEAKNAIVDYGSELLKNTAFNKEWGAAIDSNVFKQAAFMTGVQNQVAALQKSKVELLESRGALSEYNRQIATGEPQLIAYQQAQVDLGTALNDTDVKIASTQGHIDAMNTALSTGRPQAQAYAQGWQEVSLGMQKTELEIAGTMGQIDSMNAALQTGVPQLHAYTQGWLSVQQGLQESIIALAETRGEIDSMNAALEKGIPQGIAFLEGINSITQAEQKMIVETARLAGEAQRMGQSLGSVEQAQLRVVNGFLQGTRTAQDFIAEIDTASGSALGYRQTLEEAANAAGIVLPQGINTSNESLEKQIAIFKNSASVIQEYANQINEAGNALGTMFAPEKLKDINDEVDDWADELRDQWDIKITKGLEEDITQMNLEGAFETKFSELAGMLTGLIGRSGFEDMGEAVMEFLSEGVDNASPQLEASISAAMDAVRQVIANCGSGGSDQGCAKALEGLNNALATFNDNVSTSMDSAKQSVSSMADQMVADFGRSAEAVDQLIAKLQEVSAAKLGPGVDPRLPEILSQSQALDEFTEPGGAFEGQAKPDFGAEQGEIAAIQDQIKPVEQALQDLQVLAAATVQRIILEFNKLGPAMTTAAGQVNLAFSSVAETLPAIVTTAVGQMNLAFSSIGETWPTIITSAVEAVNAQLQTLSQGVQLAVGQMNLAFTSIQQTWPPIAQATVTAVTAQLQQLGQQTQLVVGQMNQAFTSIQQTWTSIAQSTVAAVTSTIQQLSPATQAVVGEMNTAFTSIQETWPQIMASAVTSVIAEIDRLVSATQTAAQQMISELERVAESMLGIGSAAQSAESDVVSLSNAIENIPDGDFVIRGRWDIPSPPPGITAAGVGLGFSLSGTVTYTASGRSGGGFGGGGLGGGQQFGGGGVEPALQHQFQHGLGNFGGKDNVKDFNELGILSPVLVDHPMKMLVGENGPELVSVTPVNRNRTLRSGEMSPFVSKHSSRPVASFQHGLGEDGGGEFGMGGSSFGGTINIGSGTVVFKENQAPVTINNIQGGGAGGAGLPTTGGTTGIGGGPTGQQGTFNVPGGQVSTMGNAVACVNGQCFGNPSGFGPALDTGGQGTLGGQGQQQGFQPIFDELGNIKAIETLIEWFKFLGLPTGASVPGTANFTNPSGTGQGPINMTGGNINFDNTQGDMELKTSTGTIAIAGKGGAFAQAGRATAGVGLFGGETLEETQERRQLEEVNNNLQNIGNQISQQNTQSNQFQQQQQIDFTTGFEGLTNQFQQFPEQMQTAFGTGMGQLFQSPGFTGFGQTFQPFQGGGAVGSGTNDPLGFLNQQLGGFGIPTPAGIPAGGGTTGGGAAPGGTGTGGCINLCQGSINAIGGGTLGGGGMTGGGGGGGVAPPGQMFGGGGEPSFQGGGGGVPTPAGGGGNGGGTYPNGNGSGCACSCMPMDSDPNRYKIEDGQGNDCNNNIYFDTIEECHSRLNEICPGENTNQPPTQQPPGSTLPPMGQSPMQQPGFGGGQVVAIAGPGFGGGPSFGQPGSMGPIGNPPIPPTIVQQAGLPSQAPDVNQDPTTWTIVESAGLVGTYDIIDDSGDVVQLGFRTLRDAETYLNYFISYYEWVQSGSTGIPGPTPVPGTGIGGGGGFPVGGTGGINFGAGGGITATAGNAAAQAGGGGAFAQAGNALAIAGGGLGGGGTNKFLGPTPVPDQPFEPIPRAQGPFRSGQDNQEPIFDNSGIKIGADFGSPGDTVTMEDVTEGGGGKADKPGRRFRDRLARHRAAFAAAGNSEALAMIDAFASKMEEMFGNLMISLVVNNMIDGQAVNRSMNKFQLKKVSVFS